jgi:hypothetical protein
VGRKALEAIEAAKRAEAEAATVEEQAAAAEALAAQVRGPDAPSARPPARHTS